MTNSASAARRLASYWAPAFGLVLSTLAACGGSDSTTTTAPATTSIPTVSVADAATRCPALSTFTVPPASIGVSTSGAVVASAALTAASAAAGTPEYCKVLGQINATNAADPPIKFEVNLPTTWNSKAMQFGGGGFNGTVVTGTGNVVNAAATAAASAPASPLARNYFTFGGDSGSTSNGSFGLNAQALANYGGESVKRTHDAALAIASQYYGTAPAKMYYSGGSKGGHEGLVAAQKYGADYDGIIAYYPANQNQAMVLSWYRMWNAAYTQPGGYLNPAKQALLKNSVMTACDALDGATDGIVSNLDACQATFAVNSLRCPGGTDTGDTCLSDAQINTLVTAATPMVFDFPLANGITSIGPYPVFNGGDLAGNLLDTAGTGAATSYRGFYDPVIRYFDIQDPAASSANFDYRAYQGRVQQISQVYDSTNPNIDTFKNKGSKLILIQGTTDMLVTHTTTDMQYNRMAARYGNAIKDFVKYYVVPGFGHGAGTFGLSYDSLSALEGWVERGQAPAGQVGYDANAATSGRSRPLCEYPLFPKYSGTGDVNSAASYSCAAS